MNEGELNKEPQPKNNISVNIPGIIAMNIKFVIRNGENLEKVETFYKTLPKIHIGKLPIMLKSSICVLNQYNHVDNNFSWYVLYITR